MKLNPSFLNQPSEFWALVKFASETLGYSNRSRQSDDFLKRYEFSEIETLGDRFSLTDDIDLTVKYLNYRADVIENEIRPLLMNREEAEKVFNELRVSYTPTCHLPMNKQKGEKRHYSYLTCIINMLTEKSLNGRNFEDNPRKLCLITDIGNKLVKTMSRRVDGAYPDIVNPIALWEIKEYYGTTTFGSRVADGVYETLLDGYEIIEAEQVGGRSVKHYLIVDDSFTWWAKGKSYLCRLIDMAHAGFVDEVIFGKEALTRWPEIVKSWYADDLPGE